MSRNFLITLVLLAALNGCKADDNDKSSKSNDDLQADNIPIFDLLNDEQRLAVCTQKVLIVFFGNAEEAGAEYLLNSGSVKLSLGGSAAKEPKNCDDLSGRTSLYDNVRCSRDNLKKALEKNNCGPFLRALGITEQTNLKPGKIMLASIIDGPGGTDSEIETSWYGWDERIEKWDLKENFSYKYEDKKLVKADENENPKFEIDFTKSISKIALELNFCDESGICSSKGSMEGNFDQHAFIFKADSGMILPSEIKPDITHAFFSRAQKTEFSAEINHVFMFDTHGPGGSKLSSNIFAAYWGQENGCKIINAALKERLRVDNENRDQVVDCIAILNKAKIKLGPAFAPFEDLKKDEDQTEFDSGNADEGTLDAVTVLKNSLGKGKEFLYRNYLQSGVSPLNNPEYVLKLGAALSFDLEDSNAIEGVEGFYLVSGKAKKDSPTLILFDGSYGKFKIKRSVTNFTGNQQGRFLVVANNPNTVLDNVLDYKFLTGDEYVAFPKIITWAETLQEKRLSSKVNSICQSWIAKTGSENCDELIKIFGSGK